MITVTGLSRSGCATTAYFVLVFAAQAAVFTPLGHVPSNNGGSGFPNGVSDDGGVVAGDDQGAFRWTAADGMEELGTLPGGVGSNSSGRDISGDGKVIVGDSDSDSPDGNEAFRWTEAGGMQEIGDLGGEERGEANAVSADGSVIVGLSTSELGLEAFRWTAAGGMVGLGDIPGGDFQSEANGVSADGSVVVGVGRGDQFSREAFRWTEAGGMVSLGFIPGAPNRRSIAWSVSPDGNVVVGAGSSPAAGSGEEAFKWTQAGGMVALGDLPGGFDSSRANDASTNGEMIVGNGDGDDGRQAVIWTEAGGVQPLKDVLIANGATGLDGWALDEATAVSADGRWVVGFAQAPGAFSFQSFLAFIPPGDPGPGPGPDPDPNTPVHLEPVIDYLLGVD